MSILIKGADISPDHIQGITVFPEGFAVVEEYEMLLPIKTTKCEVASVPTPHGRLIDADEFFDKIPPGDIEHDEKISRTGAIADVCTWVLSAPTVIGAEDG